MMSLHESHPRASVPHSCFWHSKAANSMPVVIEVPLDGSQPLELHQCLNMSQTRKICLRKRHCHLSRKQY